MKMLYFDHDTSAYSDDRIISLRLECGGAAVDAYWTIIEKIYREESGLPTDGSQPATKTLAHQLCTDGDTLDGWMRCMVEVGLLDRIADPDTGEEVLMSDRIRSNIAKYQEKCETARRNGGKRRAKTDGKADRNRSASASAADGGEKEKEKEKEKETEEPPIPPSDEDAAEFAAKALNAFNEITGKDCRDLTGEAYLGLRRIFESGRTIEDVRKVVAAKSEQWGDDPKMSRFIRPSTIFGTRFDEYLNEERGSVDEWAEYR